MEKLIVDGKVAVVVSEKMFWSTQVSCPELRAKLCMNKKLARAVYEKNTKEIPKIVDRLIAELIPEGQFFGKDAKLCVAFVPVGAKFVLITNDDYLYEDIRLLDEMSVMEA